MKLFLASNIGGIEKRKDKIIPTKFFEDNDFLKNLKDNIPNYNKFVVIASNPDDYEKNDNYLKLDMQILAASNLIFKENIVLDNRNKNNVADILDNSSLVFLSGGDTYMQNQFFNNINLKKYIKKIGACIVGISAGSINSAKIVYNSPKEKEDLNNPTILDGLNLTTINVEPHFDCNNSNKIKMDSIIEESYNRVIYGLPDKSYIFNNTIYGKCYRIHNGIIELISSDCEKVDIW